MRNPLIVFSLLLLAASLRGADTGWVVTTADFAQQPAAFVSIDDRALAVIPLGAQKPIAIPFDKFLEIDRPGAASPPEGSFCLHLVGGDRIYGKPTGYRNEQVQWENAMVGRLSIPLKRVRAMVKAGQAVDNLDAPREEDKVYLANGDSASGIVSDITPDKIILRLTGSDLELPMAGVAWVHFAPAGAPAAVTDRAFRIALTEGTVLTVRSIAGTGDKLQVTVLDGGKCPLPLSSILSIEQLNGPVAWLSSLPPQSVVQTPFFGSMTWPTRMDLAASGKPIRFATRTYERGIGVHAYSRVEFALPPGYKAFRTQYAIAPDFKAQYADVNVRIKVDGQPAHERQHLRAGEMSPVVVVDLPSDAKRLTLEVDYGDANDTQDHFNWIEPALLKEKPAPPPTPATRPATQPATPATRPTTAPTTQP